MEKKALLLWLKDNLDHLASRQELLEWAPDAATARVLVENMIRDLECCRRLCEQMVAA
jgi:hypothetical protein